MKIASKIYTVLLYLFLYAPIFVLIFFSFNEGRSTSVFEGFSLKWYQEILNDSTTLIALRNTLLLAVVSSGIATVIGTAAAVGIDRMKSKYLKSATMSVTNIPMMNPDIVTGISMMLLFVFVGVFLRVQDTLGFATLLLAHVTFNLPYVILNVLPKLRQTDPHLEEAAQDLGCTPIKAFAKTTLPSISPAILTGLIMSFTLSLDDFIISYFVTGPNFQTLPLRIYAMTKKSVKPDMYALSTIIFVVILVLLILINVSQAKAEKNKNSVKPVSRGWRITKRVFAGVAAVAVAGVCIFGFPGTSNEPTIMVEGVYTRAYEGTVLNVYNWGEYISDGSDGSLDVNAEFEKLTGIHVNYAEYDSNESMYTKLKNGGASYDIVIPSEYMVERLIKEGLIRKIDTSALYNYDYIAEEYKDLYYDPNNEYSVPYTVGMVGLIYNTKMVEGTPDSWSIMWDRKYEGNVLTFNNSRDAFGIAQYLLGQDVNTTNVAHWQAALDKLKEQKPCIQAYVMDEVFNKMEAGNAAIAPYYAGDFLTMQETNPDLAFVYPKEGTNIFVDSVCIPSSCGNYEAAMMYIDFLMEPEVALANAEMICYASPNTAVINHEDYSLRGNEYLYPSEEIKANSQYFHNLDSETLVLLNDLWSELKLHQAD